MTEKTASDGQAPAQDWPVSPMAAGGRDVYAAIAQHGDPEAEPDSPTTRERSDSDPAPEAGNAPRGYLWITLRTAFIRQLQADAGPFVAFDAACAAGRELARRAGQSFYTMAEFTAAGDQLTPTVQWPADSLDASDPAGETASDAQLDTGAPAQAGDAPKAPDQDPVEALYGNPTLDETDAPPPPSSHWARRKRRRARRR